MGRKVFVSYKHNDNLVMNLTGSYNNTVRDYVDYLANNTLRNDVYKGEGDEDLSEFKDDTIRNRLKDKIHDSSVTLVLISPNMKDNFQREADQWIPWEIAYSLKEIIRQDQMSHTNGVLAVVLPDINGRYDYFIKQSCSYCESKQLQTNTLFQILRNNMFNAKDKELNTGYCHHCFSSFYNGNSSYIQSVKWCDFISNKDSYLDKTVKIRDNRKSYDVTKEV